MKALVWPAAMYGCESWTLRKNEEARVYTCTYVTLGVIMGKITCKLMVLC